MQLEGKVAIVTGAGGGIGKTLATRLARDGASVVVADVRNEDAAAAEIAQATAARTLGLRVDVASESDVARMAAETARAFGRIDILVNNAAFFSALQVRPFENIDAAEWRRVMEVNTLGVFLCCREHVTHGAASRASRAIPRDQRPEDLAGAVSFLASADAAFITGQTLVVDGGSAMV